MQKNAKNSNDVTIKKSKKVNHIFLLLCLFNFIVFN